MKLRFAHIVLALVFLQSCICKAQDPIITQFFLVPETLNPSFTGYLDTWHVGVLHRRQWPNGNRRIDTNFGFINKSVSDEIGLGLTFLNHREVFTNCNYFQMNGAFAYKITLDEDWSLRPSIEAGFGNKNFNFDGLLLEDQINTNDGNISASTVDPFVLNNNQVVNFFDMSAGIVLDKEGVWFGASLKHLTRPNISFKEGRNVSLDLFLSIHGAYAFDVYDYRFIFPPKTKLLVTANYMRQSQFNRLDIGTFLQFQTLTIGATAATNLERKSNQSHLITSINPSASVQFSKYFVFGYSYDVSTSRIQNTQGVHELSLTWQLEFVKKCIGCPNYENN